LLKVFIKDEVGFALKQMPPLKTPGPTGFLQVFFKIIGSNWVMRFVRLLLMLLIRCYAPFIE
jgi:hypothetical protein